MANQGHLEVLGQGVAVWNEWRRSHGTIVPNLSDADIGAATLFEADLSLSDLSGANLSKAGLIGADLTATTLTSTDLRRADLTGVKFVGADLTDANLSEARLLNANFSGAQLINTNLSKADLSGANFFNANLDHASLSRADLSHTNLSHAILSGANLTQASTRGTLFNDIDLSEVEGLETVSHWGPSEVSISTIYNSGGQIPEVFLRGCGVPEDFISYMRSLTAAAIEFYSCFISYSGRDEEFAKSLRSRMREAGLRVWFAPEDMKGGDKIYDQIDRAIQVHDRLMLVLSENSLRSKWVENEIRRARKVELKEGRQKLFPIRLVSYEALQEWVCIDSTSGEDLAEEVRSYFIPDFSNWKNYDDFERAFARLLADLKASA